MSRPFEARYTGICACGCEGSIRPGDEVMYDDGDLLLADCAASPPPRNPRVPCPSCHMIHAGECL